MASRDEMPFSADNLRFFAGAARNLEGKSAGEYIEGYTSMIRREPIGVVAGICPWNYPLMMAVWKMGPALAAGNVQILKPSEQTPLSLLRFGQLAQEVIPPGVLQVMPTRSSASTSSSAARRRWWSSTTPTPRPSRRGSASPDTGTPARTAPPARA